MPDLKPSSEAAAAVAATQATAAGRTSTEAGRTSTAAGRTTTAAGQTSADTERLSVTAAINQAGGKLSFAEFEKAAKKLKMLLDNGIISQEEFESEKQRLVSNMEI